VLKPVSFYFLRHGETAWNRRAIMQGHTDIALDPAGEHQAREVAAAVAALPIATICASPLQRALRTAEIVNVNRRPIALIDELKECCFGVYEGQPSNGPWREAWRKGATLPGVEPFEDFVTRVLAALTKALQFPGPVLVVGHGGNFWAIERLMGAPGGVRVANCALFRVDPPATGDDPHWRSTLLAQPASPSVAIGEAIETA
jgi:probable phosphoglycerate mutase